MLRQLGPYARRSDYNEVRLMRLVLRLEYACTDAEREEAQSLSIRKQLSGGSKWRAWVVLWSMLLALVVAFYFQIQRDLPPASRPYVFGAFILTVVGFTMWKRRTRPRSSSTSKLGYAPELHLRSPLRQRHRQRTRGLRRRGALEQWRLWRLHPAMQAGSLLRRRHHQRSRGVRQRRPERAG